MTEATTKHYPHSNNAFATFIGRSVAGNSALFGVLSDLPVLVQAAVLTVLSCDQASGHCWLILDSTPICVLEHRAASRLLGKGHTSSDTRVSCCRSQSTLTALAGVIIIKSLLNVGLRVIISRLDYASQLIVDICPRNQLPCKRKQVAATRYRYTWYRTRPKVAILRLISARQWCRSFVVVASQTYCCSRRRHRRRVVTVEIEFGNAADGRR